MTILLHQYDTSPFSEKVRVCLGIKQLDWAAVDQPVVMPKPDLLALTGGYRRIPVMQIGADIYCDSVLIVRELERRFPEPTLFPSGTPGLDQASAQWTDRGFFQSAVTVIFAGLGDAVGEEFIRDREALSGQPFDPAAMRAAVPHMAAQLRAHAALVSEQLADGRTFLSGDRPGLVDANAYCNLWFVRSFHEPAAAAFEDLPGLGDWYDRVRAIGHGQRSAMSREDAVAAAADATPEPGEVAPADTALAGREVTVSATDYGRDPITGTLVGSSPHHVAIRREDPRAGAVVVHLPRIGFAITTSA
ncbi:glutathione S-transferase family protein [Sphingomonas radiodurans]|uniref:glutathione S-transferase family protein n=1 Tax=Sphingomonas radiodurans TaxID=2890321 RepID=UPI001E2ADBB4|nr:glutathione S-transferase family protein [Sphingomonas radiodurans]WBH17635.1 glutathione S-transferase family protein [Sphingomonas radiodurans]